MEEQNIIHRFIHNLLKRKINDSELNQVNKWYDSYDSEEELTVLTKGNENEETVKKRILSRVLTKIRVEKKERPVYKIAGNYWRAAASIAFFFMMALGALYFSGVLSPQEPELVYNEKITKAGEKSVLTYADGTTIVLNGESKLKYPNTFGGSKREVYLEGEAYFEVAHNPESPFIVNAGKITTYVLGTKFDVKAFPGENEIAVSLIEGKVKVSRNENGTAGNEITLVPSKQVLYDKNTGNEKVTSFDIEQITGWRNNVLKFDDEPLSKVIVQLERAYGIQIELSDASLGTRRITANFDQDTFWTIVKVIREITKLRYKTISDNGELQKIILYK